ncbi:MAG: alpha/beta fold hydrolase, partial [Burkholderiales bacterium]
MKFRNVSLPLAAALAFAAFSARADNLVERVRASAAPYEEIVHVAVRSGVDEPVLLSMAAANQKPKRILMLFPGDNGVMRIRQKAGGTWLKLLGNFLIRTRARFVDAQDMAVSVDMPSDQYCCANDTFRLSDQHAADAGAIIAALSARFPGAEIYVVGTSRGTISAASLAAKLGSRLAGVVLTSTVTQGARDERGLSGFDFGTLKIPVLFVHHKSDTCRVTPYYAVEKIAREHRFPLVTVTGSDGVRGADCQAFNYHGYAGREHQVAAAIMQWVN